MHNIFPFYSIGHFINQADNSTEFEILHFDNMEEPQVDDVHKHSFYEIIWIDEGRSRQTIDYKSYDLAPSSLFFISPNQVHEFEEWQPLKGGSIMFTEDFYLLNHNNKDSLFELSFLDNFYANPSLSLHANDFAEVRQTISMMAAEQSRMDKNDNIVRSLLHILLAQVQRSVDRDSDQPIPKKYIVIFKAFKNLLDAHFSHNERASFYADQLNITQHHLNRVSKMVSGRKTGEVIRARSMLEAKRMLTFTDATVTEISDALGFLESSYFTKVFKAETGIPPLEFKLKMSEKYRKGSVQS